MTPQLQKKLASWVEHGLVSPEQAARIVAHESREPSRPWTLYGIAGIGVTAVVTGVVSVVAANWEDIPAWFKLSTYFALQAAVGWAFVRSVERPGFVRETWLTLFAALFFAGIGLIAQTFNLHGDGWQALLLWVLITLPAVTLASSWGIVHLWVSALLLASVVWAASSAAAWLPDFGKACVAATVPVALLAAGLWGANTRRFNPYLRSVMIQWGAVIVLFVGTPLGNSLWGASPDALGGRLGYLVLPWLALIAAGIGVLVGLPAKRETQLAAAGALWTAGLSVTLPLLFSQASYDSTAVRLTAALAFFVPWVLTATAAAHAHHKRWFDVASLIIALRIVIVYFEVFGSLAMTGIGLILSGGVILAIAYAWHRFRSRVREQLGSES